MATIADFLVRASMLVFGLAAAVFALQTVITVYFALATRWSDWLFKKLGGAK